MELGAKSGRGELWEGNADTSHLRVPILGSHPNGEEQKKA